MPQWDSENLSAPHTQREIEMIDLPRPAPRVLCGDCLQVIDESARAGHLSWCPFDGFRDFPKVLV